MLVSLHEKMLEFYKPIYIDFAVLKSSDYHYNVIKRHYKHDIEPTYTDIRILGNLFYENYNYYC